MIDWLINWLIGLEDLRALSVESGGWLSLIIVRTTEYVKVEQSKDINTVCQHLEQRLRDMENK